MRSALQAPGKVRNAKIRSEDKEWGVGVLHTLMIYIVLRVWKRILGIGHEERDWVLRYDAAHHRGKR